MAEQKSPSAVIKAQHERLRRETQLGNEKEVWSRLLASKSCLEEYSSAMRELASGAWVREGEASRVAWCVKTSEDYFTVNGLLHKLLLKDLRRRAHSMPTIIPHTFLPSTEEEVETHVAQWQNRKYSLLDVGSCYNPFLSYRQFDVTALDIAPAHKSVIECDFLSVSITAVDKPTHMEASLCVPSGVVLYKDNYDIVVFSLLLSYFPLPQQRLECCIRAHQALKFHGLLLIITPDSSHQNRHAPMMKAWKTCIECVGFHRCKYFKDTHLHCMAFRKVVPTQEDYSDIMRERDQLYIPQDYKQQKQEELRTSKSYCTKENLLSHLPFFTE